MFVVVFLLGAFAGIGICYFFYPVVSDLLGGLGGLI